MSYYTEVRIERSGDDTVTDEQLLAAATKYLSRYDWFAVEDIVSDLADGLKSGKCSFSDLRSTDLTKLFQSLSRKYPKLTIRVEGQGEESPDKWAREFHGGKITFRNGPPRGY